MPDRVAVSSADFIRNIGFWQNEALRRPVSITHHGRERLVLAAPDEFDAKRTDQAAVQALADAGAAQSLAATLSDHMEEGFLQFDDQLRVEDSNAVSQAFLGRGKAEIAGATVLDLFPQPIASILQDRLQTVRRARQVERFEATAFDGRTLSLKVLPTSEGAILLFQNITEIRVLRQRMEEYEAGRTAASCHPMIVPLRLDTRARVEWVDDKFGAFTGFDCGALVGHRFVDLVATTNRRQASDLIERVLSERTVAQGGVTFLGRNGVEYPGHLTLAPVLSDYIAQGVAGVFVKPDPLDFGERSNNVGHASA